MLYFFFFFVTLVYMHRTHFAPQNNSHLSIKTKDVLAKFGAKCGSRSQFAQFLIFSNLDCGPSKKHTT